MPLDLRRGRFIHENLPRGVKRLAYREARGGLWAQIVDLRESAEEGFPRSGLPMEDCTSRTH